MERANRLSLETSPYLLQHAKNPVDWYPWGQEALARARETDRPILLSIGYAACHWCHVMERESFENLETAALMNEHFVCIKVDREERPDLDDIYMTATVAMNGSGGWPMTVFLTPAQEPFFAGTYFPPTDRHGRPGFPSLLARIHELWQTDRAELTEQAEKLSSYVRQSSALAPGEVLGEEALFGAARALADSFDPKYGGFGKAPKFPPSQNLLLLLRHQLREGDANSLAIVRRTLDGMKDGGIYDQLGGGFARYSTDERWHVPHFEKMLYDNAQLARVYTEAFQATGDVEYRRVAQATLDYVVREMQSEQGGYFSATDADSEGEEGKFFVWEQAELTEALSPDDAERFAAYYDVTPEGNWEGKNVLRVLRPVSEVARELGIAEFELETSLARGRTALYAVRQERVPPLLDDKILVSWNGLMIDALAYAERVFPGRGYLGSAERAARFLEARLTRPDGGLFRTFRAEKAHLAAYLEDYAFLAHARITLYESSGNAHHLEGALLLAERLISDFGEQGGPFFSTAHDHEALLARPREGHDGALPSPNAVAALALLKLARHLDRPELEERAREALLGYARAIERQPRAFPSSLIVVDWLLSARREAVLVGAPGSADLLALAAELALHYDPTRLEARALPPGDSELPLVAGKSLVNGGAALYVCEHFACAAPVTTPAAVAPALIR